MKIALRTVWLGGQIVVLLVCGCATLPDPSMSPQQYLRATMRPFETQPYVELSGEIQGAYEPGPFYLLMGPEGQFVYRRGGWCLSSDGNLVWQVENGSLVRMEPTKKEESSSELSNAVFFTGGPFHLVTAHLWQSRAWREWQSLLGPEVVYEKQIWANGKVDVLIKQGDEVWTFSFVDGLPSSLRRLPSPDGTHGGHGVVFTAVRFPQVVPDSAFSSAAPETRPVP